eukprot:TRINITY_DN3113_c1_g1_i1.p3 TRINITY_DN3113_c1_g1~~TRINITY_DN3113_c1_g1_i1.p3  ORF type:complete len:111 (-),score=8.88 TRINITY_DN3113_c1_g1_i1:189-521(-)
MSQCNNVAVYMAISGAINECADACPGNCKKFKFKYQQISCCKQFKNLSCLPVFGQFQQIFFLNTTPLVSQYSRIQTLISQSKNNQTNNNQPMFSQVDPNGCMIENKNMVA